MRETFLLSDKAPFIHFQWPISACQPTFWKEPSSPCCRKQNRPGLPGAGRGLLSGVIQSPVALLLVKCHCWGSTAPWGQIRGQPASCHVQAKCGVTATPPGSLPDKVSDRNGSSGGYRALTGLGLPRDTCSPRSPEHTGSPLPRRGPAPCKPRCWASTQTL